MLFPDPSCIAKETIQKLHDHGIYQLIGADWVAISTITFRGRIFMDASMDIHGVDGAVPAAFLREHADRLTRGERLENVRYQGLCILVIRFRATDSYACYNIYCRRDGPFEEKDILWLRHYSRANLEITRLNNENTQNAQLIDAVFNSINSAVLALRADGTILLSNQYAVQMLQLPGQEAQCSLLDYFDESTAKELAESMADLMGQRGEADLKQLTAYSDSSQKIYQMTMSPLKNSKNTISGVVLIVNDITGQKMMELELEQLRQFGILGDIAVGLAHDIKNPLMNILGCTKIVLSQSCPAETRDEAAHIIQYSASRIDSAVEQMLSYGRIGPYQDKWVDINSVLQTCITMTERQKFDRKVVISAELEPELPPVRANNLHIQQIFLNILLNAMQAIEHSGVIRVMSCLEPQRRTIRVVIEDSGTGIPECLQSSIFHPYVTTKEKGSGLGLFIVKQTLEKYHGEIELESREGVGTRFTIRLPAPEEQDADHAQREGGVYESKDSGIG